MALRQYLIEEVALDCVEGLLSRREALRRLGLLGVSVGGAATLLAACSDSDDAGTTSGATPGTTVPSSPASNAAGGEEIRFPGPNGELIGVLAPASPARGAVLVIHENRGRVPFCP
jgi:carboxymethylenebutenolidase